MLVVRSHKMKKNIVSLLLGISLCGCVSNVGNRQPFSSSVNNDQETLRPTKLHKAEIWKNGSDFWLKGPSSHFAIMEKSHPLFPHIKVIREIPAGTPLRIKSVKRFTGDGSTWVQALGQLYPDTQKEMDFVFRWGFHGELYRAPWEPTSIPEKRLYDEN